MLEGKKYDLSDITITLPPAQVILQSSFICMNIFDIERNINTLISESTDNLQFNHIHVDVMDNSYVPRYGMYPEMVKQMKQKYPNELHFHTHIMADSADSTIRQFAEYSDIVYFHLNSVKHPSAKLDIIKQYGAKAGIVVDRHQYPGDLYGIEEYIDAIMVMGINPGVLKNNPYQALLDKISMFRIFSPTITLAVDGGVTMENIRSLVENGVNNITCGSKTLYNNTPLLDNITNIKSILAHTPRFEINKSFLGVNLI